MLFQEVLGYLNSGMDIPQIQLCIFDLLDEGSDGRM